MAENQKVDRSKDKYDILQNQSGEILIIIQQRSGGPEMPLFLYDGTENALLYRSQESAVYFNDIAPAAWVPLKSVVELQVVEIADDDVIREYKVPVRIIKDVKSLVN